MRKKKAAPFLEQRDMSEAFIVCRIDDYNTEPNLRGGFSPGQGQYLGKGGMLWPNEDKALIAASWVLNQPEHKDKGRVYGVFKMVAIVQSAEPVIPKAVVTKV